MERGFDVVVIGAGPAGEVLAGQLSDRGARGTTRFGVDTAREVLVGSARPSSDRRSPSCSTIAIAAEVPLRVLAHAVPSFPMRSELWLKFVEAYEHEQAVSLHAVQPLAATA